MKHNLLNVHAYTRRKFFKVAAINAAGLLAACSPSQQQAPAPGPVDTAAPTPGGTIVPTPVETPAPIPTPTPQILQRSIRRPDIVRFYPAVKSMVVRTQHKGVWQKDQLSAEVLRQMLEASITQLTGLKDANQAWGALFAPDEKIAIKVNAFRNSSLWTHAPLVMALTGCLVRAGIPAENITIFDYMTSELETAGYPLNPDGAGVRCRGTDYKCGGAYTVGSENSIKLSNLLLESDALINVPVLKFHGMSGSTFALKNHYGTVKFPENLHNRLPLCIAELNALPEIKDRTRLVVGDILEASLQGHSSLPYWTPDWKGDSILMSFDPVANDYLGVELLKKLQADVDDPDIIDYTSEQSSQWLQLAGENGLGANDPANMEVVEQKLG